MTPSLGSYLAGSLSLVLIAAALGFGAYNLRRWITPEFRGAPARLVELVLAVALLVLALQLVGTVGLLSAGWIPAACVVAGVGAGLLGRARAPAGPADVRSTAPNTPRYALGIALGVAAWTVADWSFPAQLALDRGMFGGDSVWYHMPFSARFAQEQSIAPLHFTDPLRLAVWFYPQAFELLNGAWIALFESDFLAPLMNLGWLALGLLAAWCCGRPYGVAPATLVAAALVFDSGVMWETQAGEARNDIMALALLLACAAILVNGHRVNPAPTAEGGASRGALIGTGPLIVAGLAAGLAIATKLTMLIPVAAIALGVIMVNAPRARRATGLALGGAIFVTGAYWYARNLVHSGNPLPLFSGIGPIELPHPEQMELYPRPPHSVAGYLLDPSVYRHWFLPQLDNALGPLWPLLLLAGLGSALHVLRRAGSPVLRVLAAAALLTAVAYVLTPIGASGPEGEPKGFFTNTRYLMAALLLGLVLLPLARPLRDSERRRRQALAALSATFAVTTLSTLSWTMSYAGGAVVLAATLILTPAALAWLRSEWGVKPGALAAMALGVAALAIVLGRAQEVQHAEQRYTDPEPFFRQAGPIEAFSWARDISDRRIGVVGAPQVLFTQYGWYGADLSNHVQYVGVEGPRGAFTLPETCRELRGRINAGSYDYVVATRFGTDTEDQREFPVRAWMKDEPALEEIVAEEMYPQPDWVYRVDGDLNPAGCGGNESAR